MRLAYFITSYRSPDRLVRLASVLRTADPEAEIVVHHDAFASPPPVAELRALGARLLTSDHPIVWGDITLEAVRWRVFAQVLADTDAEWVVLLSEQDYPVAPLAALKAYLARTEADAVMEVERVDEIADPALRHECMLRYGYRYHVLPSRLRRFRGRAPRRLRGAVRTTLHLGYRIANKVQRRVRFYTFAPALDLPTRVGFRMSRADRDRYGPVWYSGAWYALSRRAAEAVVVRVQEHPDFVHRSARTIIPLESATATIVCNTPGLTVENAPLHHIRWSDPASGRPDEFGRDDLPELVGSGRFFARKFPVDDQQVLDDLDVRVLGEGADSVAASADPAAHGRRR